MKINQIIINEMTAGSVASVAMPIGKVNKRTNETVKTRGLEPAEKIISGRAKKKGPYANSLSEAKKDFAAKLAGKIAKSNKDKKDTEEKTKQHQQQKDKVEEAKLDEDDLIIVPGKGLSRRSGFIPHDPDKAEHEGQTLKNSLHTIIRVATHLNKELSTQDNFPEWVSEKIGAVKHMMVTVMDYLISDKEMNGRITPNEMTGGVVAGGGVGEARVPQLPTRGADYSKYDTDHLEMLLRPGILHRNELGFKKLIRKELERRRQAQPVNPKDLVVPLSDVPVKKPRGHTQYDPSRDFPDVFKKQGVAEMDNRTPQGDRREQRANSPEEKAKREKEFQDNLKKAGPKLRKKLRLPEPKDEGVAEEKVNEKFASQQQAKLMYAVAGDPKVAKKTGVSQSVAKEFIKKSHGQKVGQLPKKAKKG